MKKSMNLLLAMLIFVGTILITGCSEKSLTAKSSKIPSAKPSTAPTAETAIVPAEESSAPKMTIDELKKTRPNEYIPEKIAAGIPVDTGMCCNTSKDEMMLELYNGIESIMKKNGIGFSYASCEFDPTLQYEQFENYITMKVAGIFCNPMDVTALKDLHDLAVSQGITVVFLGCVPDYECNVSNVSVVDISTALCNMALAWVGLRYPDAAKDDSIGVMVLGLTNNADNLLRTQTMVDVIDADTRCKVVFTHEFSTSVDDGFNHAQEAFTANPNLRIGLAFTVDSAIGISNYVIANVSGEEWGNYAAFSMGNSKTFDNMIDISKQEGGKSIVRGAIKQGNSGNHWASAANLMCGLLIGDLNNYVKWWEGNWTYCSFDYSFTNEYDNAGYVDYQ